MLPQSSPLPRVRPPHAWWPRFAAVGALVFAAGAACGEPPPASLATSAAVGQSPTLAKIRRAGAIYLAHADAALPFSYLDDAGEVRGYTWELCLRVVDAVKAKLALPDLQVVPVLTGPATRILAIETGNADLACGPVVNTDQRARTLAFSNSYFVAGFKALVRKDSGVQAIADLKGKTVVTASGSTAEGYVKSLANRRGLAINTRSVRNGTDGLAEVANGRAAAFVFDDVLLHRLLADPATVDAGKLTVVEENFAAEPYGLLMRKDAEFKKLVDEALVGLMQGGEFERLYGKWLQSPIPPQGINLQLPMSPELKQLTKTPNDRGV